MVTKRFRGDAVPVAQTVTYTPPAASGQTTYSLSINGKSVTVTQPDGTSAAAVAAALRDAWNASTVAEHSEVNATVAGNSVVLTAATPGVPFVITTSPGANEQQTVTLGNSPTGGTFTLSFDGQTTAAIAYDATAGDVEAALESLSTIGSGDVSVTGSAGGPWTVEFIGDLAGTDVALLNGDNSSLTGGDADIDVTEPQTGGPAANEQQTVQLFGSPTGGTFALTFAGSKTAGIAFDATAAAVETALEALPNIGAVTVTGGPLPDSSVVVEFVGSLANTDVAMLKVDPSNLTGGSISVSITTTQAGVTADDTIAYLQIRSANYANDQQYRIDGDASVTGGTFTLTVLGQTTGAIAYDATPDTVMQAIHDALPAADKRKISLAIDHTAAGLGRLSDGSGLLIAFASAAAGTTSNTVTIDSAALTGGGDYVLTEEQSGSGFGVPVPSSGTLWVYVEEDDDWLRTTNKVGFDATPEQIADALESGSAVPPGSVTVTAVGGRTQLSDGANAANVEIYKVVFHGLAVTAGRFDNFSYSGNENGLAQFATAKEGGSGGTNEIQQIAISGTPATGTFELDYQGGRVHIDFDAGAADVQSALESLNGISAGDVSATGGPLPGTAVDVEFVGGLAATNVAELTVEDTGLLSAVTETVAGNPGQNAIIALTPSGNPHGGTFTLTHSGNTTAAIAYDASAADIAAALEAIASIGAGDVSVTGDDGGPWSVEFTGALAESTQSLTATAALDNGTLTVTVTQAGAVQTTTESAGPHHWDDSTNWDPAGVPVTGDTVAIDGSVPILYGLDQAAVKLAGLRIASSFTAGIGLPRRNASSYWEYRSQYLTIGLQADAEVTIGHGKDGAGSGRIKIDFGIDTYMATVLQTSSSPVPGVPAIQLLGSDVNNELLVIDGDVGVATEPGQSATLSRLTQRSGVVTLGSVTLTTLDKTGGELFAEAATLDGTVDIRG